MLMRPKTLLRRTPQQERSAFTVSAVLEAGSRLVVLNGPAGLRMTELAQLAGVSAGTLYQYFPDRAAVLGALIERICVGFLEEMGGLIARNAAEPNEVLFDRLAAGVVEVTLRNAALKRAMAGELLRMSGGGELEDASDEYVRLLAPELTRRLGLDDVAAVEMARAMVWAADGLLEGACRRGLDRPEAVATQIRAVWTGLCSRPTSTNAHAQ